MLNNIDACAEKTCVSALRHHDTMIESEDHVILFLVDKKRVPEVERLFAVGATFL